MWRLKGEQVKALAVFSLSFIVEPSILAAQTMKIRSPGVLPPLITILMECGDIVLVRKSCAYNIAQLHTVDH